MKIHETGSRPSHMFWCPGCDTAHGIADDLWTYNGDPQKPTFSPSVLVQGGSDGIVCHSFVTAGRIEFLSDCTHSLAGHIAQIPDWPIGRE